MYKCLNFGHVFEEPKKIGYGIEKEYACPICGDGYEEAVRCANPRCMNWKLDGVNTLCCACATELKNKIIKFFDGFTAEEEEQFDIWMDGYSITDRESFEVDDEA